MTTTITKGRVIRAAFALTAVAAAALGMLGLAASADTPTAHAAPAYFVLTEEDGSAPGQQFPAYWDATTHGNHEGESYVLVAPACTDRVQQNCDDALDGIVSFN